MIQPPDESPRAYINHEREVVTYGWLWHASHTTNEIAKSGVNGGAWQRMASIILTAFTLEAFLNHIGADVVPNWRAKERWPVLEKLAILSCALNIDVGLERERPLSTVLELFRFRNELAHGRTTLLMGSQEDVDPEDVDRLLVEGAPRTDWEQKVRSEAFADLARFDVEGLLRCLHRALPPDREPLFFKGIHFSGATLVRRS